MEDFIRVSAVLDHNNVLGQVILDQTLTNVVMKLKHTYKLPQGGFQTILLDERNIADPSEKFNFTFMNPRYLENLSLEFEFHSESSTITETIDVLEIEQEVDYDLPSNPVREGGSLNQGTPDFSENIPFDPPEDDIIIGSPDIQNIIFDLSQQDLEILQQAERQEEGLYSEEATENVILNPTFDGTEAGYFIEAPGFTQEISYFNRQGNGILRARAENTSLVNAFGEVKIKSELFPVNQVSGYITVSTYYQQILEHKAKEAELFLEYYNSREQLISTDTQLFTTVDEGFDRAEATFIGVPSSTTYVSWGVILKNITDTSPISIELKKPQFEYNNRATTFTPDFREFDAIRTGEIQWKPSFYMKLKSYHSCNGLRGLVDTTISGQDGFRWMISNNQLQFRVLDDNGNSVLNVRSSELSAELNEEVEYGISVEEDKIIFYENSIEVSSHSVSYPIFDFSGTAFVGRLEPAGAALNSKILDFGVYRSKP